MGFQITLHGSSFVCVLLRGISNCTFAHSPSLWALVLGIVNVSILHSFSFVESWIFCSFSFVESMIFLFKQGWFFHVDLFFFFMLYGRLEAIYYDSSLCSSIPFINSIYEYRFLFLFLVLLKNNKLKLPFPSPSSLIVVDTH